MSFCSKGLNNEFEAAVVNEPSVFEPLKFYCINKSNYFIFSNLFIVIVIIISTIIILSTDNLML